MIAINGCLFKTTKARVSAGMIKLNDYIYGFARNYNAVNVLIITSFMIICEWENWNGYFVSGKLKNFTRLQTTHTTHSTTHSLNFRSKIQIFSLLLSLKSPNFPKPKPKNFIIFMDHQEQEALKFFADFIRQETAARESGSESVSPPPPSPPSITNLERARQAVVAAMDDDHILNTEPIVFCNIPVEQMEVLRESRVNFNNMAANKMDLWQDVSFQGW